MPRLQGERRRGDAGARARCAGEKAEVVKKCDGKRPSHHKSRPTHSRDRVRAMHLPSPPPPQRKSRCVPTCNCHHHRGELGEVLDEGPERLGAHVEADLHNVEAIAAVPGAAGGKGGRGEEWEAGPSPHEGEAAGGEQDRPPRRPRRPRRPFPPACTRPALTSRSPGA
jgi:hypothetical protein